MSLTLTRPGTSPRRSMWRIWLSRLNTVFIFLLLLFFSAVFLLPLLWLVITALKPLSDLAAFPIRWWPSKMLWQNFVFATTSIDFWTFAANSFFLASLQSVLATITSAMVGFGFARLKGRGKRPLLIVMLSTLMLPATVSLLPTYVIFSKLGLVNTYWPWVLWGLGSSPFLSFLFRQFFSTIPVTLEEAAIMDGANYGHIFWRIFLPLSRPVLATSLIFSFSSVWGDWLTPKLFLNPDQTTLTVAMSTGYVDSHGIVMVNVLAAGCVLYILPMLILFFVAQKSFTKGIVTTGLKG